MPTSCGSPSTLWKSNLKAVLLLNGRSSKGYGHDIVQLYTEVKSFAVDLLPETLARPEDLNIFHWRARSAEAFIQHLLHNGNADNRYAIYGYATGTQDLHMLDQMVFAVRRLVCELDGRVFQGRDPHLPTFTHREMLTRQPEWCSSISMPLDDLIRLREDSPLRSAALNLSMAFASPDYPHEPMRSGNTARDPVIVRRILHPLASDDSRWATEGVQLAEWFLANVQVPKGKAGDRGVVEQIRDAIEAARAKHGIA